MQVQRAEAAAWGLGKEVAGVHGPAEGAAATGVNTTTTTATMATFTFTVTTGRVRRNGHRSVLDAGA